MSKTDENQCPVCGGDKKLLYSAGGYSYMVDCYECESHLAEDGE